jgi:3-mercaptopyruvate sulfurtransferase SseA
MKKLYALLTISLLLTFGCAQTQVVPVQAAAKPAANTVDSIKTTKEEGVVDKAFFRKILAEKPSNVAIVDVRTPFEYKAGHFDGAKHVFINDLYDKGCDATLAQFPKEGYVVFVCATGARAGEMYSGILDDCKGKVDAKRLFFLDAEVAYMPTGAVIK